MVIIRGILVNRVSNPKSNNQPPKNSDHPARKASKSGKGKPNPQSGLPNHETTLESAKKRSENPTLSAPKFNLL